MSCKKMIKNERQELSELNATSQITWLDALHYFRMRQLSHNYLKKVERVVNSFIQCVGNKFIEETSPLDLAKYLYSIQNIEWKVRWHRAMLLSVGRYMYRCSYINILPFDYKYSSVYVDNPTYSLAFNYIKTLSVGAHAPTPYYDALYDYAKPIFCFLLLNGCQMATACLLKKSDLCRKTIIFHEKVGGKQKVVREVVLNEYEYKAIIIADLLQQKLKKSDSEYIFINEHGCPWNAMDLYCSVKKAWKEKGLLENESECSEVLKALSCETGRLPHKLGDEAYIIAQDLDDFSIFLSMIGNIPKVKNFECELDISTRDFFDELLDDNRSNRGSLSTDFRDRVLNEIADNQLARKGKTRWRFSVNILDTPEYCEWHEDKKSYFDEKYNSKKKIKKLKQALIDKLK